MRRFTTSLAMVVALVCGACFGSVTTTGPEEPSSAATEMLRLGLRGVYFVPNRGQWSDADVHFGLRSRGLDVAFRESSFTMHLRREAGEAGESVVQTASDSPESNAPCDKLTLGVSFPGSNPVLPQGAIPQTTRFNYFVGGEGRGVAGDVPSFGAVVYSNLYDGIDLHVSGNDDGILKYEFHVAPNVDHSQIRIAYDGIESLCIDDAGDLHIETTFGTLRDGAPLVWQDGTFPSLSGRWAGEEERLDIPASFIALDDHTYTITLLTDPDPSLALIIDPEIEWMYYVGGGRDDRGLGVAVDHVGNALVTGTTSSNDFVGRNNSHQGDTLDAFALKIGPSGQVDWMTYLGGAGNDEGLAIAVDGAGNALVTGQTRSGNFFGRNNSYQGGNYDAFALKVTSAGKLLWMTYLGGADEDYSRGIGVDVDGSVLVSGSTISIDFTGRSNSYYGGSYDAFALRISPSGQLLWMSYLGGRGSEGGQGVSMDSAGNALVTGSTSSTDFYGRNNSHHGGSHDAFALKIDSAGSLQWMTYLGGGDFEQAFGIALDGLGDALVTGETRSTNFAGRNNTHHGGSGDVFALKVSPKGDLKWMTYLGGTGREWGLGIAGECAGGAVVTGFTESTDFVGQNNSHHGGREDAFAVEVSPSGALESMTHLGGSGGDWGYGIALDGAGNALVTGMTGSVDFAGRENASYGLGDAFLAKLRLSGPNLSVETSCPGSGLIRITWEGAKPGGRVSLLFAREAGSVRIPPGWPCEGIELGLGRYQIHVVVKPWSDEFGAGYVEGIAGAIACGGYMQLLDLTSCATSNVVRIE